MTCHSLLFPLSGLTQPLKSDTDIGQAWVSPGTSTPEYLKEALGMKKPKYSRSASSGNYNINLLHSHCTLPVGQWGLQFLLLPCQGGIAPNGQNTVVRNSAWYKETSAIDP